MAVQYEAKPKMPKPTLERVTKLKAMGLSHKIIGERLGVSTQWIQKLLRGNVCAPNILDTDQTAHKKKSSPPSEPPA